MIFFMVNGFLRDNTLQDIVWKQNSRANKIRLSIRMVTNNVYEDVSLTTANDKHSQIYRMIDANYIKAVYGILVMNNLEL